MDWRGRLEAVGCSEGTGSESQLGSEQRGRKGRYPFPEGYKLLDPARIIHVHLRDFKHNAAGKVEWCAVGEGEADNLGQSRALVKDGLKGTGTLETHLRPPQGKAYASSTSLKALLKVIEKA